MTSYFTGVIGAMIADSWLGKYRWVQKKSFYSVQLNSKGSCGWWSLLFKKTLRLITQSKVVCLCLFIFVFSIEPSPTHCSCIPFRRSFSHWQVLTLLVSGIRKYPQDTTYIYSLDLLQLLHFANFSISLALIFFLPFVLICFMLPFHTYSSFYIFILTHFFFFSEWDLWFHCSPWLLLVATSSLVLPLLVEINSVKIRLVHSLSLLGQWDKLVTLAD